MAVIFKNTNYSGEVLNALLTVAATGNELVEKGLIRVEPGISKKFSIPRLKTGKMLQKRKEQPTETDSKGDFTYSEAELVPVDFMAFTTFNPRSFEQIWRPYQPKGNLVFAELPIEAQNALLSALSKQVTFELGGHFINGVYGSGDDQLFNGIVTRIMSNNSVIKATGAVLNSTMIAKLGAVRKAIPAPLRAATGLKILMSLNDFDKYDEELTALPNKGANYTDMNVERFKGIQIVPLAQWPDDLIVATVTGMDITSNLWAAVNLEDDFNVIEIDKLTNAGEKYFMKMLMKADTNVAFGEECVMLDVRTGGGAIDAIAAYPEELVFSDLGSTQIIKVDATSAYTIGAVPAGFTVDRAEWGLNVTTTVNTGGASDKQGTLILTLDADGTKTAKIELFQGNNA